MIYKHILVAVDGSDTSILALNEAIRLAKDQKGKLRIIHVLDEQFVDDTYLENNDYEGTFASLRKKGQHVLNTMTTIAQTSKIGFESKLIEMISFKGEVADKIMEEAKSWPADLIVIGTHGRHGFNHLLMGSVAEGVIRITTMPVLLIRSK